jgi:hypothetical protein
MDWVVGGREAERERERERGREREGHLSREIEDLKGELHVRREGPEGNAEADRARILLRPPAPFFSSVPVALHELHVREVCCGMRCIQSSV